jgi:drug/metabolite transporter (DMT)-like permease
MIDQKNVVQSTATAPSLKLQAFGIALIILSTIAIAIVPSLAKFAYEGGSNTLSVITGRSFFSVLITLLLILVLRQPLAISRTPLLIGLATGVGYAVILYGYLGAVNYLAVSLVVLIYFIHPLLVGVIVMCLGQERLTPTSLGALMGALVGLGLAIGFSIETPDPLGIGLATMAMVVTAVVIVGNARAMKQAPALSVGFYMMLSAAAALAVLFFLFGSLALPNTGLAWIGFIGVAIAATTGTLAFMCGMAYVGAARAAMITNIEPVLGVLFAIAILGEKVTLLQSIGIVIVIGAIFVMERQR